jgi:hypothetical protein
LAPALRRAGASHRRVRGAPVDPGSQYLSARAADIPVRIANRWWHALVDTARAALARAGTLRVVLTLADAGPRRRASALWRGCAADSIGSCRLDRSSIRRGGGCGAYAGREQRTTAPISYMLTGNGSAFCVGHARRADRLQRTACRAPVRHRLVERRAHHMSRTSI